jgi:flagellar hook protein FlgE
VQFSRHALQRLERRGIAVDQPVQQRLDDGVSRAAGKGAREAVVFVDGTAFVVSVRNRRSSRPSTATTCATTSSPTSTAPSSPDDGPSRNQRTPLTMMRGMYSAISGLKAHQVALDVTANDLANVNTVGYKGARATFQDSLTQVQRGGAAAGGATGGANPAQVGLGTQLGGIDAMMGQGAFQATGNATDIAIQGEGFFRVGSGNPAAGAGSIADVQYTRAGNFTRNSEGYLTTQDGQYVIGRTAGTGGADTFIQVPPGSSNFAVGANGEVSYVDGTGARATAGFLQLAKFSNIAGLERTGANAWRETAASGARSSASRATATARRSAACSRCRTSTSPPSSPT